MSLPSFLVIGAQKAGTSWLWVALRQSPHVWMPPVKELHFFDHLFVPQVRSWTQHHIRGAIDKALKWHVERPHGHLDYEFIRYMCDLASNQVFTEAWYRRAYSRPGSAGKVLGDITPEYSTIGPDGIAYIKSLMPDVKIVYIIRDPVSRALSQVRMSFDRKHIVAPSPTQWQEQIAAWDVSQRGDYATYIPQWRAAFPDSQLLFLPYKQLEREPSKTLAEVERFINATPYADYKDLSSRVHSTKPVPTPPEVAADLRHRFAAQYDFLGKQFSSEFLAQI